MFGRSEQYTGNESLRMTEFDDFTEKLEAHGARDVRAKLTQGVWANRRKAWAEKWLAHGASDEANCKSATALSLAADGNATAKAANTIAEDALRAARSSKNAAWVATFAAVIAAGFAIFAYFQAKP